MVSDVDEPRITWRETRGRLAEDRRRIHAMLQAKFQSPPRWLLLQPSYLCVLLHRIAHYFWRRGGGKLARLMTQINSLVTGADIDPRSDLGGGLLIPHPVALTASGKAGKNLTMMPLSGIGMLPRAKDVGAGPGLPWLGDDVWVGPGCGILGPVRVGSGSRIEPGTSRDVPPNSLVESVARAAPVAGARGGRPGPAPARSRWVQCSHRALQTTGDDFRADVERYLDVRDPARREARGTLRRLSALLTNELFAIALYRLAHFLYCNRWRRLARFICGVNFFVNRITIGADSCIGGGAFLPHPAGLVFGGVAGSDLTMYARSLCMPVRPAPAVEGPVLGDDVVIAGMAALLGPLRVGNHVRVGFCTHLSDDVPNDRSMVSPVVATRAKPLPSSISPSGAPAAAPHTKPEQRPPPITLAETCARWREDRVRVKEYCGGAPPLAPRLCVLMYRMSHYCACGGGATLARWLWRVNVALTGADIDPRSDIGGGFVIPHPVGIAVFASAGRNLTVLALSGIGAESAVNPEPDRISGCPWFGDDVVVGEHVFVCGDVRIGSGACLEPGCRVTFDVDAGVTLRMPSPRPHRRPTEPIAHQDGDAGSRSEESE